MILDRVIKMEKSLTDNKTVNDDIDKKLDDIIVELDITNINNNLEQFNWLLLVFLIVMILVMGYGLFFYVLVAI